MYYIHDCSVADMPQIKKCGGGGEEVESQCLIKIGKRKKSVGLKIKVSERREHCVYFYLYKLKYSTIDIQLSYLWFQKNSPASKTRNKQTNKQTNKTVGEYNSLLTHFICRVIMILSIPGSGTMGTGMGTMTWVWVRVRVNLHVKSHEYGSKTRSMGTGTNFRIRVSIMSTGMGKGTTSLLSWALYSCNWKTGLKVCPWRKALQNQFSVTSNTGTLVVHTK